MVKISYFDQLNFSPVIELSKKYTGPIVCITDTTVHALYAHTLKQAFKEASIALEVLVFPAGEPYKTRKTKAFLEDQLIKKRIGKSTLLIALGGGVVTDMCGYIASTYMRGVAFISLPTTLLAMVDAAIGGKTGINTPAGKNLIGTFYFPQEIFIYFPFLHTLEFVHFRSGIAEMIKYGALFSKEIIKTLFLLSEKKEMRSSIIALIPKCIAIKENIVQTDLYCQNIRNYLNFGHTIAHAIEVVSHYTVSHGDAVAIGMIVESFLSMQMGLEKKEFIQLKDLVERWGFPLKIPNATIGLFLKKMYLDKKNNGSTFMGVILEAIGKPRYVSLSQDQIQKGLQWMMQNFAKMT